MPAKKKTTKRSTKVKAKPAKKIKASAKKKVVKIVNPHVGKRFFRIELAGYGGELIVGNASEEFVTYWTNEDRKDSLGDHMHAMNDITMYSDDMIDDPDYEIPEGYDKDSPEVYEGAGNQEYWNFDDIEHNHMLSYEYTQYTVTEITPDPRTEYKNGELSWQDKYTNKRNFDWSSNMFTEIEGTSKEHQFNKCVVDRELFLHTDKKDLDDPVPVIMMYDSQKGTFGHLIVMTNGEDFDPDKFVYSSLDNTMSSNAEHYYYDKVSLSFDNTYLDTWGKGFFANAGWVEKEEVEYNWEALLEEGWRNLEDAEQA